MTRTPTETTLLTRVEPFSLIFERSSGRVVAVGATMEKVAPGQVGRHVGAVLRLSRPTVGPATADRLLAAAGVRLRLTLFGEIGARRGDVPTPLHGAVHPLGPDRGLLVLSFGARILGAVARHRLDSSDFAVTDATVELLYAIEARNGVERIARDLQARVDANARLAETLAKTDPLTGLANRRALDRHLDALYGAPGSAFGLLHIDLDLFKQVNDTMGHAAGDAVLVHVAAILRDQVRDGDMVARIGGDEFVLVLSDDGDTARLAEIGRRIVSRLEVPITVDGQLCHISGSVGVSVSSRAPDPSALLEDADRALYAAKRAGRARVTVAA
jgi:diguanylate cyclase (GGDEF)-like protein